MEVDGPARVLGAPMAGEDSGVVRVEVSEVAKEDREERGVG